MLSFDETSQSSPSRSSSMTLTPSQVSWSSSRKKSPMRGAASRGPLPYKLLQREPTSDQDSHTREMALYYGESVLAEWKGVEREMESKLKHRIKLLAALFQDVDCAGFHSLSCLGTWKTHPQEIMATFSNRLQNHRLTPSRLLLKFWVLTPWSQISTTA